MNWNFKSTASKRATQRRESKVEFETLEPRQLLCTFRAAVQTANALGQQGTDNVQIQFQGHEEAGPASMSGTNYQAMSGTNYQADWPRARRTEN